jgi:hypothetical protein
MQKDGIEKSPMLDNAEEKKVQRENETYTLERGVVMNNDYGSMIWVNDREGRELVCTADFEHMDEKDYERLNERERKSCSDVSQLVEAGG